MNLNAVLCISCALPVESAGNQERRLRKERAVLLAVRFVSSLPPLLPVFTLFLGVSMHGFG
jgi:hypothetical protein